jgi:hypothetical protein
MINKQNNLYVTKKKHFRRLKNFAPKCHRFQSGGRYFILFFRDAPQKACSSRYQLEARFLIFKNFFCNKNNFSFTSDPVFLRLNKKFGHFENSSDGLND